MSNMNMPGQKTRVTDANMERTVIEPAHTQVPGKTTKPILKPNAAYLAATTLIDISWLPYGSLHNCITDPTLAVNFSTPLEKLGPVPLGWSTWSSPPFSESATPDILVSAEQTTLTMDLSEPVSIFGFELEPNPFATLTYIADFYYGETLVGSINRNVDGDAGARLFALRGDLIDRVVVSGPDTFAIANLRLQQTVQSIQRTILIFSALLLILVSTSLIL
ncbi:MAG: hypothetical protein M0R49_11280 [Limnochordia bacterium]|nr:hypothetical protein [Limnochordia bacterium]